MHNGVDKEFLAAQPMTVVDLAFQGTQFRGITVTIQLSLWRCDSIEETIYSGSMSYVSMSYVAFISFPERCSESERRFTSLVQLVLKTHERSRDII
jgi:hypothetical protein